MDSNIATELGQRELTPSQIESVLTFLQQSSDRKMTGALATWRARRVVQLVDSILGQPIRVKDLAQHTGLSTSQFSRSFHTRFGVTCMKYVALRRMEFAKAQMRTTDLSLAEIALLCGMSDQSHFSKTFRKLTGTTPLQWRNFHRE